LGSNQLSGNIPVQLTKLINLLSFDLSYNYLVTTVEDLGLLAWLTYYDPDWAKTQYITRSDTVKIMVPIYLLLFSE